MRKNLSAGTLAAKAQEFIDQSDRATATFRAKLEGNPAYAFEWSREAFDNAGRGDVGHTILAWLERVAEHGQEKVLAEIQNQLTEMVIHGARFPHRSTSPQSNEMAISKLSAQAELLSWIRGGY